MRSNQECREEPAYDVVVVGFGPVGAVAACWLGQAGIRTLVIEKSHTIVQIPRAIAMDHEIMRVFQNFGIAEEVLPYTAAFPASEHFGAQGQLIRRIDAVPPPYPLGYTPTMVFTQPAVESILRDRAASFVSVEVLLDQEVTAISQSRDAVSVEMLNDNGDQRTVRAKYVIACDGASSTVRRLLGIKLHDLGFDEPWLVVDVRVNEQVLSRLPRNAAQYCNPERPTTYIVGPGNHRRWEIMLLAGEDPREMEKEQAVWHLLKPWLTSAEARLWRAGSYRFHALLTTEWRTGRVFVAGDAAHQQPPFLGQGMCQGIRDVTNLAWKLKAVLAGEAGEPLLDTYGEERGQHVLTLTTRIKEIGRHICERDPEAARLRDESLLAEGGGQARTVTRQEIVPPLQTGLMSPVKHAANGTLFPQPSVVTPKGAALLDTITGQGWRVILDGRYVDAKEAARVAMGTTVIGGMGVQEQDGIVARWFDRHECIAAIVRPDHYVYGTVSAFGEIHHTLVTLKQQLGTGTPPE
jgi:3-(3-hydroxy-phenyl)propionate hydroxylase